jgi:hypothetical protein
MRIHLILIFIVSVLNSGCANQQSSVNPFAKSDEVVLEVITNASGMVYPKEGDILNFRLYESGRFEYDDYPNQDPPRVTTRNVVITKKEAKLNTDEVKELINLAEQPDFLAAKENYPRLRPHVDDQWTTIIIFTHQGQRKRISAVDFWDMLHYPEDKAKYPTSMAKLLEKVRELKAKAIAKS